MLLNLYLLGGDHVRSKFPPTKEDLSKDAPEDKNDVKNPSPNIFSNTEKRTVDSAYEPTLEILTKLSELERMDLVFSESLDVRFNEMQKKLEAIESTRSESLNSIFKIIDNTKTEVDELDFDDLKRDVKDAVEKLVSLKARIEGVETAIEGADQKATNLHGLKSSRSTELQEISGRFGSGFLTYLLIFQVLFCACFVLWKNTRSDKQKKNS